MYRKKYRGNHLAKRRKARYRTKGVLVLCSLLLMLSVAVGGTVAYLFTDSDPVQNNFTPSQVDCEVTEDFDSDTNVKKDVNVTNEGNTDAYIRVKLVTYRINDDGKRIGGAAEIPGFDPGNGWNKLDGFWYYVHPVAANNKPEAYLIGNSGITLEAYTDVDGGYQVIEVMAEAIQALGTDSQGRTPTQLAWGVTIDSVAGTVTAWSDN